MNLLPLRPDQIIAMIDYPPLQCPGALERYFQRFLADAQDISPVPVVSTRLALEFFRRRQDQFASFASILEAFMDGHPAAEYFMLGGYHRSAAAVLAGRTIPCVAVSTDDDFREINASERSIRLHGDYTTIMRDMVSIDEELQDLEAHFHDHRRFWTVEEKVRTMVANGDVPASVGE